MDTLLSVRIFCQIVKMGSFTKAADFFDISTATVSKHISALEKRVNAKLFHRSTRALNLTEQGANYYRHCQIALEALDEGENELANGEPQGVLRVVAPLWFASPVFAQWLAQYRARYPKVQLLITLKNRSQEQLNDADEIALRVAPTVEDTLIARKLGEIPFYFVAAPDYLHAHGTPQTVDDLAAHDGLLPSYTPLKGIRTFYHIETHQWLKPTLRSNNTLMLHELALAGQGIAFLPEWVVKTDIETGKLRPLFTDLPAYAVPLYAVYQHRQFNSAKMRSFLAFLQEKNQ